VHAGGVHPGGARPCVFERQAERVERHSGRVVGRVSILILVYGGGARSDVTGRVWKKRKWEGRLGFSSLGFLIYSCAGGDAKHFRGGEVARSGDGYLPMAGTADSSCLAALVRRNDKVWVVARTSMTECGAVGWRGGCGVPACGWDSRFLLVRFAQASE
jgi:hypothetical protein